MTQGLFASVTGIQAHQAKLNVISNNIANVSTVAFKGSIANFSDLFSQTLSGGSRPSGSTGGVNPRQIGLGTRVSEITVNMTQGGTQFTGRSTDVSINGNGFFTVEKSASGTSATSTDYYLTRAGNFNIDSGGNLVTPDGLRIRGTAQLDGSGANTLSTVKLPQELRVSKIFTTATGAIASTQVGVTGTADASFTAAGAGQTRVITNISLVGFTIGSDGAVNATYSNGDRFTVRTDSATISSDPTTARREIIHLPSEGGTFAGVTAGAGEGNITQVAGAAVFLDGTGAASLRGMQLQIQTASFPNPQGLVKEGSNYYSLGPNSGDAKFGAPGVQSRGALQSAALESSNVDLSTEFTNLIITQRGLEANSRTLRVQNDALQAILNII